MPCSFGGTGVVAVLVGVNGVGNLRGRAPGAGFYAIFFDATECGADEAGLYGCRFDAQGNVRAWDETVFDSAGDAIVIEATN